MNKSTFIKWCKESATTPRLVIQHVLREREIALYLNGSWYKQSVLDVQLYRPTPGRQWEMRLKSNATAKCESEMKKYQRWIDEFQTNKV